MTRPTAAKGRRGTAPRGPAQGGGRLRVTGWRLGLASRRLRAAGAATLIALVCVAAFAPVHDAGFITDDHPIVRLNPLVQQGGPVAIFTTGYWEAVGGEHAGLYRPVTIASFALERGPAGEVDPARAHRLNLLLHALTSLAVLALVLRLGGSLPAAVAVAALFAAHPAHVSAVAGLVGRAEILSTLFSLGALLSLSAAGPWPGTPEPSPARARACAWAAALCLFLALGAKEGAAATPVLLVLLELLFRSRAGRTLPRWLLERCAALAPCALALLVYVILRTGTLQAFPGGAPAPLSDNPLAGLHGVERLATAVGLLARYARLLAAPARSSVDYSGNVIAREPGLLAPLPLAGLALFGILGWLSVRPFLRRRAILRDDVEAGPPLSPPLRLAAFGAASFLFPYLVVANLLTLIGVAFAERLAYLPSAGACLLAAAGLDALRGKAPWRAVATSLTAVAVVAAVVATHAEARHWKTNESVFEAAVRATPASPRAQFTLGKIRVEQGRLEEAMALFDRTVELWPAFSAAWYEKGVLHARRGELARAEEAFAHSVRLHPWNPAAQADLGIVLHRLGRTQAAEKRLRATLRHFPDSEKAASELAHLLFGSGRYHEAARWYRKAVALGRADLEPNHREALRLAGAGALGRGGAR